MAQINGTVHKLFHEAQQRASQPQPVIKYKLPKSLLLPAPNNIIFELFNTVVKEVSTEYLMNFVKANIKDYLKANWSNKITQQAIRRLKREQTIDVRAGLVNAPLIRFSTGVLTARPATTIIDTKLRKQQQQATKPSDGSKSPPGKGEQDRPGSPGQDQDANGKRSPSPPKSPSDVEDASSQQRSPSVDFRSTTSKRRAIDQIYEHLMWRVNTDNVTQITSLLIKLVLDDGYKKGTLKVESYDEVSECFNDWRGQKLIKLYSFGSAPANDQKLILASTTSGDLTKWVANYIDGSEKHQRPDLIRVLATALRDKTKNCIYITNELVDALRSLETGAIRCVFLVDRLNHYEPIQSMPNFSSKIEPILTSGKLYVMSSLACVEFAPDPANDTCC